jgi:hypothetical protein
MPQFLTAIDGTILAPAKIFSRTTGLASLFDLEI